MEHEGYGIKVKGKPHGIWPLPLSEARKTAKRYMDKGFADVTLHPVHAGDAIPIEPPAPIFSAPPEKVTA